MAALQQTHRLWCVETITPQTCAEEQDRTGRPRPGAHTQQVWDEVVGLRTRGGLLTQRVVILPASVTEQQRRHLLDVELEAAHTSGEQVRVMDAAPFWGPARLPTLWVLDQTRIVIHPGGRGVRLITHPLEVQAARAVRDRLMQLSLPLARYRNLDAVLWPRLPQPEETSSPLPPTSAAQATAPAPRTPAPTASRVDSR
ncbi:DUF6879 family protein [Nocardiopsis alborubida]|uniref:DUF6879 domain-containing protein n=1 Tax=Nocardiopsis alborubida TaxID=146802 RepID=A0A7X6M8L6_9ACTN|nr:DUF6879 family protein [Nocardiopsis alborubida]NKY96708.1 hypothetical protein [Nocardiopsis alborubida]